MIDRELHVAMEELVRKVQKEAQKLGSGLIKCID